MRPTSNMVIREGKHVDAQGRIHLPGLHNWDYPKSSVVGLLAEMTSKFEDEPPLATKPSGESRDPNDLLGFVSNLKVDDAGVQHNDRPINKVSVIGGGDLGMASVMCILAKGNVDKFVFVDIAESSTKGSTMDLGIFNVPKVKVSKDISASAGSRVVVVTANAWSDEQSYVSVVQTNVDLYRSIIPSLARLCPKAVLLIASQPVAVLSNTGQTGTSQHPEIVPRSNATKPVLDRALEMVRGRGQRSWSMGLSLEDITYSILVNRKKVHSVSTLAQGWGGLGSEVFLSLPCVLGASGSTRLAGVSLPQDEDIKLRDSATSLSNLMAQLRI